MIHRSKTPIELTGREAGVLGGLLNLNRFGVCWLTNSVATWTGSGETVSLGCWASGYVTPAIPILLPSWLRRWILLDTKEAILPSRVGTSQTWFLIYRPDLMNLRSSC
jgi:hypothetical protein